MKTHRSSQSATGGFSLIEMLMVIAVIGILGAIGVNEISDINGAGHNAKAMRNAQNIASIFQSAQASGVDFYDPSLAVTISNIVDGATLSDPGSPFNGTTFRVPEITPDEQLRAQFYLLHDPDNRAITYNVNAMTP